MFGPRLLPLISVLSSIILSSAKPNPDPSLYKDLYTSRGLKYHYYFSQSQDDKPYLLFLHGFPSTSHDWRYQIDFFGSQGYGLVVPDMLGYGNTSKPTDPNDYKSSLLTQDLVEILDAENLGKVVAIGHDWYENVLGFPSNSLIIPS